MNRCYSAGPNRSRKVWRFLLCLASGVLSCLAASMAHASDVSIADLKAEIEHQKQALDQQKTELENAQRQIALQQSQIEATEAALQGLIAQSDQQLAATSARGAGAANEPVATQQSQLAAPSSASTAASGSSNPTPVGQEPPPNDISQAVLPQGVNILTRPGHIVFDSAFTYVESSSNLLVFRGVEIVPGVEVGAIDANNTVRSQEALTETLRYGIAPRLEVEAVVPYLWGYDRVTEATQRNNQVTETEFLRGSGLGDVEFTGRYQITDGRDGGPIVVGTLRVKPPSGIGPFDLKYDQYGAALSLPTGSGFWGVEPSINALIPTDPVVIFLSVGYLYNFRTNVDKIIGSTFVGPVDPGGSIDTALGFALALNQHFSFSLGFKDSYIFSTTEYLNGDRERSEGLQVGSLLLGQSFNLTDRATIAVNFEFGVTSDAPNLTSAAHLQYAF